MAERLADADVVDGVLGLAVSTHGPHKRFFVEAERSTTRVNADERHKYPGGAGALLEDDSDVPVGHRAFRNGVAVRSECRFVAKPVNGYGDDAARTYVPSTKSDIIITEL